MNPGSRSSRNHSSPPSILTRLDRGSLSRLERANSEIRHSVVEACFYNLKLLCQIFPERFRQARFQDKFRQNVAELGEITQRLEAYARQPVPGGKTVADLFPDQVQAITEGLDRLDSLVHSWQERAGDPLYRDSVAAQGPQVIDVIVRALEDIDTLIKQQKCDILRLIAKAVSLQDENLQRKGISVDIQGPAIQLFCDSRRMQDVFSELIRNAIKHAFTTDAPAAGRKIIFSVQRDPSQEKNITIIYWDNGKGFSGQHEPKRSGYHGLSLIRSVVEQEHGGTFFLGPDASGGVRAVITIPVDAPSSVSEVKPPEIGRRKSIFRRSVLTLSAVLLAVVFLKQFVYVVPRLPIRASRENEQRRLIPENVWDSSATVPYGMFPLGSERQSVTRLPLKVESLETGIAMVLVGAGEFTMGSLKGELSERPRRRVSVDAFYIDRYELGNADYERFDPAHISRRGRFSPDNDSPVVNMTWWEAIRYCNWRSEQDGLDPCYDLETGACDFRNNGYRLPTEAEWEKAGRATDARLFPWGNEPTHEQGIYYANFRGDDDGFTFAAPITAFLQGSSIYGAQNLLGNVWEWCNDWFDEYPAGENIAVHNPVGSAHGVLKVIRGGAWNNVAARVTASHRFRVSPGDWYFNLGIRCVRRP